MGSREKSSFLVDSPLKGAEGVRGKTFFLFIFLFFKFVVLFTTKRMGGGGLKALVDCQLKR